MLIRSVVRSALAGLLIVATSLPAAAHVGHGETDGFIHGFMHPIGGLDHMLAMVAVGLWAGLNGGRALWAWPAAFVGVMLAGGALGFADVPMPMVEPGILASVARVNPPKLLLDENLSPSIAVALQKDGVDAIHVRDRGMNAASDAAVLEKAFEEDRIVVTVNVDDFARLARAREIHAGIVLVEEGGLLRDEQAVVIRRAIELISVEATAGRDMVNRVLRIRKGGPHSFATS